MPTPTAAQSRILTLLKRADGHWVHMKWLDCTPLLQEDDFPVVPSLIENGWADHAKRSIRLTASGLEALNAYSASHRS